EMPDLGKGRTGLEDRSIGIGLADQGSTGCAISSDGCRSRELCDGCQRGRKRGGVIVGAGDGRTGSPSGNICASTVSATAVDMAGSSNCGEPHAETSR